MIREIDGSPGYFCQKDSDKQQGEFGPDITFQQHQKNRDYECNAEQYDWKPISCQIKSFTPEGSGDGEQDDEQTC